MEIYYIDPNQPDNSGDGISPETAKKNWSAVTWGAGHTYLGKGGAVANESITPTADSVVIGSYGTGRHVLDGVSTLQHGVNLSNRSNCIVRDLLVRNFIDHGVYVAAAAANVSGHRIFDVRVEDVDNVGFMFEGNATYGVSSCETRGCHALRAGQAGFHHRDNVVDVSHFHGTADTCANKDGGHGFSSHPKRNAAGTWTLVGGNVYSTPIVGGYDPAVVVKPGGVRLTHTPAAGTNPSANCFNVVGGVVYGNFNGDNPNGQGWYFTNGKCKNLRYIGCVARRNLAYQPYPYHEGHGFACDDGTDNCWFIGCLSYENEGVGFNVNAGWYNTFIGCVAYLNADPDAGIGFNFNGQFNKAYHCVALANAMSGFQGNNTTSNEVKNSISANNTLYGLNFNGPGCTTDKVCTFGNGSGATSGGQIITNHITSDPQFTNPAALDFSVQSPALLNTGAAIDLEMYGINGGHIRRAGAHIGAIDLPGKSSSIQW